MTEYILCNKNLMYKPWGEYMKKLITIIYFAVGLTACGGGGGSGGGNGSHNGNSGGKPPETPSVTLRLSASSGAASAPEGHQASLTTTATASNRNGEAFVVDLQYDTNIFSSVTAEAGATTGTYTVTATTRSDLMGGDYKGNITARLCKEAACVNVYSGTSLAYAYDIKIRLKDWQTFQRNAEHTGYVRVALDPAKFKRAWEWIPSDTEASYYNLSPVATAEGNVIITRTKPFNKGAVHALNEQTGAQSWSAEIPDLAYIGTPAFDNGKIYVPVIGNTQNNHVFAFDATTGSYLFKSIFYAQWTLPGAPVAYGEHFYLAAGTFGGQVSSHSQTNDDIAWRSMSPAGSTWGGQSLAVDEKHVYYHAGSGLQVFDRLTGVLMSTINDLPEASSGYDYNGGPIIAPAGSILSYQGWEGARKLARYDLSSKSVLWHSAQSYSTAPAYAKGFIYTAKNEPPRLDVLKESDGSIAWSWVPPIADNVFIGNAVVTDNLVFISTDKGTYAIDLATHQSVWSYPVGGNLALSPDFKLYIQSTWGDNSGGLIAISLR